MKKNFAPLMKKIPKRRKFLRLAELAIVSTSALVSKEKIKQADYI